MVVVNLVVLVAGAAVLVLVGVWGRRHAHRMARVPGMDAREIDRRARVMRRGALTCYVAAAIFGLMAVLPLMAGGPPP